MPKDNFPFSRSPAIAMCLQTSFLQPLQLPLDKPSYPLGSQEGARAPLCLLTRESIDKGEIFFLLHIPVIFGNKLESTLGQCTTPLWVSRHFHDLRGQIVRVARFEELQNAFVEVVLIDGSARGDYRHSLRH